MANNSQKNKTNLILITCVVIGAISGVFGTRLIKSFHHTGANKLFFMICIVIILGLFIFVGWVFFTAVKKIKKASELDDRVAKTFTPKADKGVIYIFRNQFVGTLKALPVFLSGKEVAWIKGNTFVCLEVPAGTYTIDGNKTCKTPLTLDVDKGEIVFIEQEIVAGMLRGSYIYQQQEITQAIKQKIIHCRLLVTENNTVF